MSEADAHTGTIETRIPADHRRGRRAREVAIIEQALKEHGSANRRELSRRVGSRYWGPGRFRAAPREAIAEDRVKRLRRDQYAPR